MVILLIEDDIHVQFFVCKLLKAEGFTVLTAGSGEAALETFRNHPGPIDLVLTDMEMPGMNGLQLYRIMAAERPGIKAIVMSGDLQARAQSEMAGLAFLQKPLQLSAILETIQTVLGPGKPLD
jgi:DNA-binding NtrC family response regulator